MEYFSDYVSGKKDTEVFAFLRMFGDVRERITYDKDTGRKTSTVLVKGGHPCDEVMVRYDLEDPKSLSVIPAGLETERVGRIKSGLQEMMRTRDPSVIQVKAFEYLEEHGTGAVYGIFSAYMGTRIEEIGVTLPSGDLIMIDYNFRDPIRSTVRKPEKATLVRKCIEIEKGLLEAITKAELEALGISIED